MVHYRVCHMRLFPEACRFGSGCRNDTCLYLHALPESYTDAKFEAYAPMQMPMEPVCPISWPRRGATVSTGESTTPPGKSGWNSQTAVVPVELWVGQHCRNPALFEEPDPLRRFEMVMEVHAGRHNVIDLHYQSRATAETVLDTVMEGKLRTLDEDGLWILTGMEVWVRLLARYHRVQWFVGKRYWHNIPAAFCLFGWV